MKQHTLKTWPELFQAVADREKTADLRRNDREFEVGDWLTFAEFDPDERTVDEHQVEHPGRFTGSEVTFVVTHVLDGEQWGLQPGFVMLSFRDPTEREVAW